MAVFEGHSQGNAYIVRIPLPKEEPKTKLARRLLYLTQSKNTRIAGRALDAFRAYHTGWNAGETLLKSYQEGLAEGHTIMGGEYAKFMSYDVYHGHFEFHDGNLLAMKWFRLGVNDALPDHLICRDNPISKFVIKPRERMEKLSLWFEKRFAA